MRNNSLFVALFPLEAVVPRPATLPDEIAPRVKSDEKLPVASPAI